MPFSGSQITALQPYGVPGMVRSFSAKTAAVVAAPAYRTVAVWAEDRTAAVPREDRTTAVWAEDRTAPVRRR